MSYPGDPTILGVTITMNSTGDNPQLTFTSITVGGPITTVTWTRYYTIITERTETLLNDGVTSQYTHILTVNDTRTINGTYSCTVSNNKPSSASLTVKTTVILTGYGNSTYFIPLYNRGLVVIRARPPYASVRYIVHQNGVQYYIKILCRVHY